MMLSLVLDWVRLRKTSPKELRQAITLILGCIGATGTEFGVPITPHLRLRCSAWDSHLEGQ